MNLFYWINEIQRNQWCSCRIYITYHGGLNIFSTMRRFFNNAQPSPRHSLQLPSAEMSPPSVKNENQARRGNIRKCTDTGAPRNGRRRPFFRLPVFVNPCLMFLSTHDDDGTRDGSAECAASAALSWSKLRHPSHTAHEKFTVRKKRKAIQKIRRGTSE